MPFVATVTHISARHLAIGPVAGRAGLRSTPALPAYRLSVLASTAAGLTQGVGRHTRPHTVRRVMLGKMLASTLDKLKIARRVVQTIVIDVVHNLLRGQQAPDLSLHDDPVLHAPAVLRGIAVIGSVNHPVGPAPESADLGVADAREVLQRSDSPTIAAPDLGEASRAANGSRLIRPAVAGCPALRARENVVFRRFWHDTSVTMIKTRRTHAQKREFLTCSRAPAWTPGSTRQRALFGVEA